MTTTNTRFRRIERIVDRALECPASEREAYLRDECAGDPALFDEVAGIVAAHAEAGEFLETAAIAKFKGALLAPGERVGQYTIVRVLGSGGGGTVYLAEQDQPRRPVALKAMHGGFASATAATRFQQEAEILARLQHPCIAHVYEAGVHDGVPYIALEYVENGVTLRTAVETMARDDRLRLFAEVCDAVHAGHLKGVVHADLKPANVLVLPSGHPKVIDFGIARVEEAGDAGEVAGTPPYMSPEQCTQGADVDLRSDIYALGVVLYELLVKRKPHDVSGISIAEAARRIREERSAPLPKSVPADLRAVVGCAMQQDPEARYGSAARLGDEVRRFLDHRPVEAAPPSPLHGLKLFTRRRRALFLALVALVLALVLGTALSVRFALRADRARAAERYRAYAANIAAAAAAIRAEDPSAALPYLDAAAPELRSWEWDHLRGRLDASEHTLVVPAPGWAPVVCGALPDGRFLVVRPGAPHSNARIFDSATWEPAGPVRSIVASVRAMAVVGHDLILATDAAVIRCRGNAFGEVVWKQEVPDYAGVVIPVLGGSQLLVRNGRSGLLLLDAGSGEIVRTLVVEDSELVTSRVAVTPAGDVAIFSRGKELASIDLRTGEATRLAESGAILLSLALDPVGARLAMARDDGEIRVRELSSGEEISLAGSGRAAQSLAFTRDGAELLSGHVGEVVRWDARTGSRRATLRGHRNIITSLIALEDGTLLSADTDDVKVWRAAQRPQPRLLGRFRRLVRDLDFGVGNQKLACAVTDGSARVFDAASGAILAELRKTGERSCLSVALHPAGDRLAIVWRKSMEVRYLDERPPILFPESPDVLLQLRWVAQGERLATLSRKGELAIWEVESRAKLHARQLAESPQQFDLCRDGSALAVLLQSRLEIREAATGKLVRRLPLEEPAQRVAAHPDGIEFAVAVGRRVLVLDERGAVLREHRGMNNEAASMAYSPDGSRIAVATFLGIVYLLAPESEAPILDLRAGTGWLWGVGWSDDGRYLATGGGEYEGLESALWIWSADRG